MGVVSLEFWMALSEAGVCGMLGCVGLWVVMKLIINHLWDDFDPLFHNNAF